LGNQRSIVMNDIYVPHRTRHTVTVEDAALDILDILRTSRILPNVQHQNLMTTRTETAGDKVTDKPGTACDEMFQWNLLFVNPFDNQWIGLLPSMP
jgi:hypothetical protein